MLQLDCSRLILNHAWINYQKIVSSDGSTFIGGGPVEAPSLPDCGQAKAEAAATADHKAFSTWRALLANEPAQYLVAYSWADSLADVDAIMDVASEETFGRFLRSSASMARRSCLEAPMPAFRSGHAIWFGLCAFPRNCRPSLRGRNEPSPPNLAPFGGVKKLSRRARRSFLIFSSVA